MAKVLLINPPTKSSFAAPPLGLMYLAASLKKAGHRPVILDFMLEEFNESYLLEIINQGIDVITISAVTPLISKAFYIANFIKRKFPNRIVVLGGPHATLLPKESLNACPSIDFIIKGEGEERINELIEYLEGKRSKEQLDGIAFREKGEIIDLPVKKYIENLDASPFPDRDLIDIKRYSKFLEIEKSPATTMITSRGCPYNCIYCSKPIFGNYFRARSPKNILEEIIELKNKYNIKEIVFYDDTFTLDRERVIRLCRLLIDKNINIRWKCESRINLVDEQLLQLMSQAGCYLIGYGIESGSQRILDILKKGIIIKQIEKAVKATRRAGIDTLGYFMLGVPGETEQEINQTIAFSKKLDLDFTQFSVATAYPGTELYQIAQFQDKLPKDWSDSFYALGDVKEIISLCGINNTALNNYLKRAYWSFYFRPSYIFKRLFKIRSLKTIKRYFKGLRTILEL